MTARERVLMIRFMEKLEKHPAYAMLLGIEATGAVNNQKRDQTRRASVVAEALCAF